MMGASKSLTIQPESVPLRVGEHGEVRVIGTRVSLESIVHAFHQGATPEQIMQSFPTLRLADVYAVIAYYLRHKAEVDEYLSWLNERAEELWRKIQASQPDMGDIKARLLARKAGMERKAVRSSSD
jgi:uncharacterized protein (DUF433 family)